MKSDLQIMILPTESSEEISSTDEILCRFDTHLENRWHQHNMIEVIVAVAWRQCPSYWPHPDRMCRRVPLAQLNGRPC